MSASSSGRASTDGGALLAFRPSVSPAHALRRRLRSRPSSGSCSPSSLRCRPAAGAAGAVAGTGAGTTDQSSQSMAPGSAMIPAEMASVVMEATTRKGHQIDEGVRHKTATNNNRKHTRVGKGEGGGRSSGGLGNGAGQGKGDDGGQWKAHCSRLPLQNNHPTTSLSFAPPASPHPPLITCPNPVPPPLSLHPCPPPSLWREAHVDRQPSTARVPRNLARSETGKRVRWLGGERKGGLG